MGPTKTVPLLVAVLVLIAPLTMGFLERVRRQDDTPDKRQCIGAAIYCGQILFERYGRPPSDMAFIRQTLSNRTFLEDIALHVGVAADSLDNVTAVPLCKEMSEFSQPVRFVADFLNFPGTIDELEALSTSPCLSNLTLFRAVDGVGAECMMSFEHGTNNVCQRFSEAWGCFRDGGNQLCGTAAGDLITSLEQYSLDPSRGPQLLDWISRNSDWDLNVCDYRAIAARVSA
ncbi:hypothetical protein EGW08_007065 [Elysia chlorotica]|uniref:Uncharacterized protein n=1 Tax=Elysia chlorotica TaxID=188477 RepID=A0A433TUC1_ELYCH|nr:hypothetical protein EGW08_007065 [Elysia chlorotica]